MNLMTDTNHMAAHKFMYSMPFVIDASCQRIQAQAGGDVYSANAAGWLHIMRYVSHMQPGLVSAELLYVFDPRGDGRNRQTRLRLFLCINASSANIAKAISVLIERGPLAGLYRFAKMDKPIPMPQGLHTSCHVVRCLDEIPALHSCDFNSKIPDAYRVIRPFVRNQKRDLWMLDKVLDKINEPVVFSCRIQPVDTAREMQAITTLVDQYHSVNHGRVFESDNDISFIGVDGLSHLHNLDHIRPLNLRDPSADVAIHSLRPIHQALCQQPHLDFMIEARARNEATAQLLCGIVSESCFDGQCYQIKTGYHSKGSNEYNREEVHNPELETDSCRPITNQLASVDPSSLERLTHLATVDELSEIFKFPVVGPNCMTLCISRNTDPPYEVPEDLIIFGYDEQGVEGNPHPIARGLTTEDLRKHLLIVAASGSGKTTTSINTLIQLHEMGVPFIVIETSKKELRIIKALKKHNYERVRKLARKLRVFTVGNEHCSPLRFNPLEGFPGIDSAVHIERCIENLSAFMPIFPALPGILGEALEQMYAGKSSTDIWPMLYELYSACLAILLEKDYCGEVSSNIKAALEVRLGSLTRRVAGSVFKCRHGVPCISDLMSTYSVIELDLLPKYQKCVLVLCYLTAIWEQLSVMPPADGLRLVVVIEECHNIFAPSGAAKASEEAADPQAFVVDMIKRLLVELRALGVGIILSDQHPTNVDRSAIKCTAAKLVGKQPDGEDHEVLQQSALLSHSQIEDLPRLRPGEFHFIKEGYYRSLRLKTPNLHKELELPNFPTDKELYNLIKEETWFKKIAETRIELGLNQFKDALNKYDADKEAIAKAVIRLLKAFEVLADQEKTTLVQRRLVNMVHQLKTHRNRLISAYKDFKRGPYRLFWPLIEDPSTVGYGFASFAESLGHWFQSTVEPQSRNLIKVIDRLLINCSTHMF
ncbi:ATP-binding protein [Planctomycetota bacterium]